MTVTIRDFITELEKFARIHGDTLPMKVHGERGDGEPELQICTHRYRDGSYSTGEHDELADPDPPVAVLPVLLILPIEEELPLPHS